MKRRMFVLGVGSATAGGSALLGTGAFTRVESHRQVEIAVAGDDEAYLQLHANGENSAAAALVNDDGEGHLTLDLDSLNAHADLELDSLFSVCNHGKQPVCVLIEKEGEVEKCSSNDGDDSISFYRDNDPEERIDGAGTGEILLVGQCVQIGVDLCTLGIDEGKELLPDGVTVYADVDGDCEPPEEPPGEPKHGISFVAFCGQNLQKGDFTYSVSDEKEDGDPIEIEWEYHGDGTVETVVLKAATWFYNFPAFGGTSGTARVGDGEAVNQFADGQSPSDPCPDGSSGVKFEF